MWPLSSREVTLPRDSHDFSTGQSHDLLKCPLVCCDVVFRCDFCDCSLYVCSMAALRVTPKEVDYPTQLLSHSTLSWHQPRARSLETQSSILQRPLALQLCFWDHCWQAEPKQYHRLCLRFLPSSSLFPHSNGKSGLLTETSTVRLLKLEESKQLCGSHPKMLLMENQLSHS